MILKQSNVQTKAAITKSQRTNWIFKIHCSKIYKVKMLEKKKKKAILEQKLIAWKEGINILHL